MAVSPLSRRQVVEMFHLVFLRALFAKGENKALLALKGGSNLRFFFGSVRFSEDIDFDVVVMSRGTLRNKVDRLLRAPAVTAPLRAHGIEIVEASAPKQTDTTQRWKAGLEVEGIDVPVRTKIEFSRRDAIGGAAFEALAKAVLRPYGITPFLANHYATAAAIAQKIHALADRTEPQARDVFDLNLLIARPEADDVHLAEEDRDRVPRALESAMSISYDDYVSRVVAYLDPEQAELFEERSQWNAMQEAVVARLSAL